MSASSPELEPTTTSTTVNNDAASRTTSITASHNRVPSSTNNDSIAVSNQYLLEDPKLREILHSDIGVESLVQRLKQSIISAKDLAAYVKKRATLEGDKLTDLKKLSASTKDTITKEGRQGTLSKQVLELMNFNDRTTDATSVFVAALHTMHDDLVELAKKNEKSRKILKETGVRNEKALTTAEANADKARSKYVSLCEEMEKFKDPNKSKFGFKPKNPQQHEEELQSKIQVAEGEYRQKVQNAQKIKRELQNTLRPQSVRELKDHILECDSGVSLQLQRYATLNEILALNTGFIIVPVKPPGSTTAPLSMKEVVAKIDDELDFYNDVLKLQNTKKQLYHPEIQFVQHPLMAIQNTSKQVHSTSPNISNGTSTIGSTSNVGNTSSQFVPKPAIKNTTVTPQIPASAPVLPNPVTGTTSLSDPSYSISGSSTAPSTSSPNIAPGSLSMPVPFSASNNQKNIEEPTVVQQSGHESSAPHQYKSMFQEELLTPAMSNISITPNPVAPSPVSTQIPTAIPPAPNTTQLQAPQVHSPPPTQSLNTMPMFGTDLETYVDSLPSDPLPLPSVLTEVVSALDKFGLDVPNLYRTQGPVKEIQNLRALFDKGEHVDLSNPGKYGISDINAVAGTLLLYFQSLPEPLLTNELKSGFLEAAETEVDWKRRDGVHEKVNQLPDANYIVLRHLVFHLDKVAKKEATNRMGVVHLGNIWGPLLLRVDEPRDIALSARVIETVIYNCNHIFDSE